MNILYQVILCEIILVYVFILIQKDTMTSTWMFSQMFMEIDEKQKFTTSKGKNIPVNNMRRVKIADYSLCCS